MASQYTVEGPILAKYLSLDAAKRKALGAPTGNEDKHPDGGGFQEFDGGAICVHGTNAFVILGKIRDKWNALGGMDGKLGFPTGDEDTHPDGGGFQEFDGGAICDHGAGTYVVWGKIRDKWNELGGMDGKLGLPTSDESDTPDGAKKQHSSTGRSRGNRATLRPPSSTASHSKKGDEGSPSRWAGTPSDR